MHRSALANDHGSYQRLLASPICFVREFRPYDSTIHRYQGLEEELAEAHRGQPISARIARCESVHRLYGELFTVSYEFELTSGTVKYDVEFDV